MSEESKSWYRMTRPLFNSGFEDNEFWAYGQDGFQEVLDSFLGSDVLIYDKRISTSPQEVRAIVQNKTSDVFNSTTVRQILCNIGILKCGQYVKFEDAFWLVVTLPDNNRIYEKAVLFCTVPGITYHLPFGCPRPGKEHFRLYGRKARRVVLQRRGIRGVKGAVQRYVSYHIQPQHAHDKGDVCHCAGPFTWG